MHVVADHVEFNKLVGCTVLNEHGADFVCVGFWVSLRDMTVWMKLDELDDEGELRGWVNGVRLADVGNWKLIL